MKRLSLLLVPMALVLASCEDADNPGDDSLLSGGSLLVVLVIVAIVVAVVYVTRRGRS